MNFPSILCRSTLSLSCPHFGRGVESPDYYVKSVSDTWLRSFFAYIVLRHDERTYAGRYTHAHRYTSTRTCKRNNITWLVLNWSAIGSQRPPTIHPFDDPPRSFGNAISQSGQMIGQRNLRDPLVRPCHPTQSILCPHPTPKQIFCPYLAGSALHYGIVVHTRGLVSRRVSISIRDS